MVRSKLCLFVLCACGGDPSAPIFATGTVDGKTFSFRTAYFDGRDGVPVGDLFDSFATVTFSEDSSACEDAKAGIARQGDELVRFTPYSSNAEATPLQPATYTLTSEPTNQLSSAGIVRLNTMCHGDGNLSAQSATVTLVEVTATELSGTFSLDFGTSGALSGDFVAKRCAAAPSAESRCLP
jgi:hypothetical protein